MEIKYSKQAVKFLSRQRKLRIYLDTSVISHLQQEDVPEKMQETRELWNNLKVGKM